MVLLNYGMLKLVIIIYTVLKIIDDICFHFKVVIFNFFIGEFIRNLIALDSGGSGGVVWRIRANETKLVCAVGSRNGTEETKLYVLDFDADYK